MCEFELNETWKYDPKTNIEDLQLYSVENGYHGFSMDLRLKEDKTTEGNIKFMRCGG